MGTTHLYFCHGTYQFVDMDYKDTCLRMFNGLTLRPFTQGVGLTYPNCTMVCNNIWTIGSTVILVSDVGIGVLIYYCIIQVTNHVT